jgi:hypothetical protein
VPDSEVIPHDLGQYDRPRSAPCVNGQQELTHYGHEELTHRGSARWVTIMRVFPPLARNVSRGRGLGHRDRG